MSEDQLQAMLEPHFKDGTIVVTGDGRHFDVRIVSKEFEALSLVKRQQLVYSIVNEQILGGKLHALNIHAVTPIEWEGQNG